MTPVELKILMHYFCQPGFYVKYPIDSEPSVAAHASLVNQGYLNKILGETRFEVGVKGVKTISELLNFANADCNALNYLMAKDGGSGKLEILQDVHREVPPHTTGCICPKDANMSCQSPFCPRMAIMERYAEADAATKPPSVICSAPFNPDWASKIGGYPASAVVSYRGRNWISNINNNRFRPEGGNFGTSMLNGKPVQVRAWQLLSGVMFCKEDGS